MSDALSLVVTACSNPAAGVRQVELRSPDGAELPPWTPGAHVEVRLPASTPLVRPYSLCGDPADRTRWRIAVLRETAGRGGSAHVHETLAVGDVLEVRGPSNDFELAHSPAYVFVAGGIGITPLVPMIAAAERAGARWRLEYGGRERASMAYADTLLETYGAERVHVRPQDETGLLPLDRLLAPEPDTLVYCCGPEPLLAAVEAVCAAWPAGALHLERFGATEVAPGGEAFEVELAESGRVLTVAPDRSVLAVLEEAGVAILSSCRQGTCGTCETGVLDGHVDHRDSLLTSAEQAVDDVMFVCVSRAAPGCPRLVLEL